MGRGAAVLVWLELELVVGVYSRDTVTYSVLDQFSLEGTYLFHATVPKRFSFLCNL